MGLLSRLGRMMSGGRGGRAGYALPKYYTPPTPMRPNSNPNLTAGQQSAMEANGLPMYIPPGPQRERWAAKASEPLSRGTAEMAENLARQIATEAPDIAQALRAIRSDRELEEIMSAMAQRGIL